MRFKYWLIFLTLFAAACGGGVAVGVTKATDTVADPPTAVAEEPQQTVETTATPAEEPTPIPSPTSEPTEPEIGFLPEEPPPSGAQREFSTDFGRHTVPYSEILSGGPPKDGIPAIDNPKFITVDEADAWLESQEPVILFDQNGDSRAYPLQILMWHEIVNDVVGDVPVSVTFARSVTQASPLNARLMVKYWISGRRAGCASAILSCTIARPRPGGSRLAVMASQGSMLVAN